MRSLVTGSNGFVGSWLVRELLREGHEVHAMCRKTSDQSLLKDQACKIVYGDMNDLDSLKALVKDVQVVFHCAAALGAKSQEAFDHINVGGVTKLVEAIRSANPQLKRVVLVSSVAAGGPSAVDMGREEVEPAAPVSQYGRSKLKGEQEIWKLSDTEVEIVVVRPPIVYGPASWSIVPLVKSVKFGLATEPGGPKRMFSYIYVEDLVEGIRKAGTVPQAAGEVFNLTGPEDASFLDFQYAMAKQLQKKPLTLRPGPYAMKFIGWGADRIQALTGKTQAFGTDKVREALATSWLVSGQKAKDILEYQGRVGLEEGVKRTLEDFKRRDWI